jgi:hypothetical protein
MTKNKLQNAVMKIFYEDQNPFFEHADELMIKVFQKAKAEIPKKNDSRNVDSFKAQEDYEEAVLDWFERWFGK